MDYQYLGVQIENRVGWLKYNRPPINAFHWEMLREMPAALDDLQKDSQVRAIVISSAIEKYFNTATIIVIVVLAVLVLIMKKVSHLFG